MLDRLCLNYGLTWRFGLMGNVVGGINEFDQHQVRLVLQVNHIGLSSHPDQLSLAILR